MNVIIGTLLLQVRMQKTQSDKYALIVPPVESHATMDNQVVSLCFNALADLGWNVLKFNFTRHQYKPRMPLYELNSLIDWYIGEATFSKFMICGYASGAALALESLMRRPEITNLLALSVNMPLVNNVFCSPYPKKGILIHGIRDAVAPVNKVQELLKRINVQNDELELKLIDDDHFFTFSKEKVTELIKEYALKV